MRKKIKRSTYSSYRLRMDKYIIPFLGKKQLTIVKSRDVEEFVNYLTGLNLFPAMIHSIVTVLKSAMNKASMENNSILDIPKLIKQKSKEISVGNPLEGVSIYELKDDRDVLLIPAKDVFKEAKAVPIVVFNEEEKVGDK